MQHLDVELAHSLLRGRLPPADAAAWERHVAVCPQCGRLVAEERSWSNLLKLEQPNEAETSASAERVLPRLEALIPGQQRRHRLRRTVLLLGSAACVGAAATAIVWRFVTPTPAQRLAAELEISEATQARIVANLDALTVIQRDPWLPDEQDTVEMFARLLDAESSVRP